MIKNTSDCPITLKKKAYDNRLLSNMGKLSTNQIKLKGRNVLSFLEVGGTFLEFVVI